MAVQRITGKRIIKHDTSNPNFDPESLKKPEKKVSVCFIYKKKTCK